MSPPACSPADLLAQAQATSRLINRERQPQVAGFLAQIREVVVIASSSRGGSSIFTEILRQSPELIHFRGEINPFLTLAGLAPPENGREDDGLDGWDARPPGQQARLMALEQELALDAGINRPAALATPDRRRRFFLDLGWRIAMQWPQLEIDQDFLASQAQASLDDLVREHVWEAGEFMDAQLFHALFLVRMRSRYPQINPHYYDLSPDLIGSHFQGVEIPWGPPAPLLIEEPPYVTIAPRHPVEATALKRQPLIIKTPSNAYRLAFLRALFPQARLRILHLTRHPADSINGLIDGWRYHGFFSHQLAGQLAIGGYSDRFPDWGRHWWKYDLPPGWRALSSARLEQVCGYQWRKAHQSILAYLAANPVETLSVRFEEVIGTLAARARVFNRIAAWLAIDPEPLLSTVTGEMPPVMATVRPRQRRWFKREELLRPVLADPAIVDTARRLGYDLEHDPNGQ